MPDGATMPHVWHLPTNEAEAVLVAAGIPYRISRAQGQIAEGHLLSVAPAPGTMMDSGGEAVLTVSSGPATVRDHT